MRPWREIERALLELPGVVEAAADGSDELVAFVVCGDGYRYSERMLREHCRARLEPRWVPSRIGVRAVLLKTATGEVDCALLR